MNQKKLVDLTVLAVAIVGSLILINIVGVKLFGRLDFTRDRQFSLSKATKDTLAELKGPVTVRAYFTADLPPQYSANARYIKDILDEYYSNSNDNFRYEFIDPATAETAADKEKKKEVKHDIFGRAVREPTSIERELETLGIPPVQVQVNEDDKVEVKRAYMGIAVIAGEKKEVIPVVQNSAGFEYDLTTLIRKLTRAKLPKIALIDGHQGFDTDKEISNAWQLLARNYQMIKVDLTQQKEIPVDVDAIIIASPKTPFSQDEKRALDAFVMSGRGAAFLLDVIRPDMQTMQSEPANHGLDDLMQAYGVTVGPGLVVDSNCARIRVKQIRGNMQFIQPVAYPFIPFSQALDRQHPLTRGLANVAFPFISPVYVNTSDNDTIKVEKLIQSSSQSWLQKPPYNLDPMQRWTMDMVNDEGAKNLIVTLSGALKSYANPNNHANNARVIVAGGASFIHDQFLSQTNATLLMNLVDWMLLDDALLAVRSRGLAAAPLNETSDMGRAAAKWINIIGVPFVLVGFGLVRWQLRERRRKNIKV
ncbi:MAG: GldG family protein [Deltaproteobacteria bacterium]|nr:GldG family protein [Deltaproteobacteria bacterium]